MPGRPSQGPATPSSQADIDLFQRAEEPGKALFQIPRALSHLLKITVPELICLCDYRRTHGPVFVRALRPSQAVPFVNPNGEAHDRSMPPLGASYAACV